MSEAANRRVYDPIEKLREDAAHLRNEAASLLEMIPGYHAYIEGHQKQAREYETAADQLDDAALALEKLASRDSGAGEPATESETLMQCCQLIYPDGSNACAGDDDAGAAIPCDYTAVTQAEMDAHRHEAHGIATVGHLEVEAVE